MTKDELIRELIKREPSLMLVLDTYPKVFIVPAILDDGRLEYQVSDGPVGSRGSSADVYSWRAAKKLVLGI